MPPAVTATLRSAMLVILGLFILLAGLGMAVGGAT